MLKYSDYAKLDGIAAAEGIRKKEFTSAELTACAIDRARHINPSINAIVHESFDLALEQAKRVDSEPKLRKRSRVAGLPFLIKDLAEVKGLATTYGSALYEGYVSPQHSNIVAKYIEAGLPILGKTNTPEFGLTLTTEARSNGPCRNPWNLDYSTGGSSGGAAAAVAAGIVPVAHASDGGGSIRIPASCCGLFGMKPSRGLTVIGNTLNESWAGMSVGHVLSRSVRDSAAFLDVIKLNQVHLYPLPASPDSFYDSIHETSTGSRKLRIAVQFDHPTGETVDQDCVLAVHKAVEICESLGHHVEETAHPIDHSLAGRAMSRMINTYTYHSVAKRAEELQLSLVDCPLEASTLSMVKRGESLGAAAYVDAKNCLIAAERQLQDFYQRYDVIIQPVLSKVPPKLGWLDMDSEDLRAYGSRFTAYSGFTALANGTGQPSMSVPMHVAESSLPVGALFTAAWGGDATLLLLAAQLENAAPWQQLADGI
ncbi:MAG: amidase [SAR86 cluster bacterium]|uniref:Amidase n=1 Tax=SAR86 cluster bacterium TaxID=2030880 RepID=A0A2A4WXL2_9GAMM|nr:MAG: amidase [SAR86 cluster bacterium]